MVTKGLTKQDSLSTAVYLVFITSAAAGSTGRHMQ